jgi:hypothetical protein
LLQPIVRGWARYRGRLLGRPAPLAAQQTLDSVALRESRHSLQEVCYWSTEPINRLAFVAEILRRLDHRGWPNKSDIGWSDFDVEIYGSHWSTVQLATVIEEHGRKKLLLRCRLRARWSLQAKATFWSAFGFEMLLVGLFGGWLHCLWLLLLTLPLLAWVFRREQRSLQSLLAVFLDELAKDQNLLKAQPPSGPESSPK